MSDFQISIGNLEYFKGICAEAGLDEETELELRELISGKNYFGAEELLEGIHVGRKDKVDGVVPTSLEKTSKNSKVGVCNSTHPVFETGC